MWLYDFGLASGGAISALVCQIFFNFQVQYVTQAALICVNLATKGLICWLSIGKECYICWLYVILSAVVLIGVNAPRQRGLFQHLKVNFLIVVVLILVQTNNEWVILVQVIFSFILNCWF